jgi:hypothetical protein
MEELSQKIVLVVSRDIVVRDIVLLTLSRYNVYVQGATDIPAAAALAQRDMPDLILIDEELLDELNAELFATSSRVVALCINEPSNCPCEYLLRPFKDNQLLHLLSIPTSI